MQHIQQQTHTMTTTATYEAPTNWPRSTVEYIHANVFANERVRENARRTKRRTDTCLCVPPSDKKSLCCITCECVLFACQEECSSKCRAGEQCGNQRLTRRLWKSVKVQRAGVKGYGVFAGEDIAKGDLIKEYVGVLQDESYLKSREFLYPQRFDTGHADASYDEKEVYMHSQHRYIMHLEPGLYLDARYKGNEMRFANHSCAPNCKMDRWKVKSKTRVGLYAIQDIKEGDELCFDYAWKSVAKKEYLTKCYCGSPNCRGSLEVGVRESSDDNENGVHDKMQGTNLIETEQHKNVHGFWVKPPDDPEYLPKIGAMIKVYYEGNAEYFVAKVLKHDPDAKMKVLVKFEIDGTEQWEDLGVDKNYLIHKGDSSIKLEKRTAALQQVEGHMPGSSMISSMYAESSPTMPRHLPSEAMPISRKVKDALQERLILQKLENYFRTKVCMIEKDDEISIQLVGGLQMSSATDYLKRNIQNLQNLLGNQGNVSSSGEGVEDFSFKMISTNPIQIAYIPESYVSNFNNCRSLVLQKFRGCTMKNLEDLRGYFPVPEELNGMYIVLEMADESSLIQGPCRMINDEVKGVFWFQEEIKLYSEIRQIIRDYYVNFSESIHGDLPTKHGALDVFIPRFEEENNCRFRFFHHALNRASVFIQYFDISLSKQIFDKINSFFLEIMYGAKYIYMPPASNNEEFLKWLKRFGEFSFEDFSKSYVRLKVNVEDSNELIESKTVESILQTQEWLSEREGFRQLQWAYGIDEPKSTNEKCPLPESFFSEIVNICRSLKLDAGVAVHSLVILNRYMTVKGADIVKLREVGLAAFHLANKSQKSKKWKKFELILQTAYNLWYNSNLDEDSEEAMQVSKRILAIEEQIVNTLQYQIFYMNLDSILINVQKVCKCATKVITDIRLMVCTSAALRCILESSPQEVVVALWILIFATTADSKELSSLFSKYGLIPSRVRETCTLFVSYCQVEPQKPRILKEILKGNYDMSRVGQLLDMSSNQNTDYQNTYKLEVSCDDEVCDFLTKLDQDRLKSSKLASFLGVDTSLDVGMSKFVLRTYFGDCRCLHVAFQEVLSLLGNLKNLVSESNLSMEYMISRIERPIKSAQMIIEHSSNDNTFVESGACGKGIITGTLTFEPESSILDSFLSIKSGVSGFEPLNKSYAVEKSNSIVKVVNNLKRRSGTFSLVSWPSIKAAQREAGRSTNSSMGVSAASLQELYLLHQLLPHPNIIRPLNILRACDKHHLIVGEIICPLQTILNRRKYKLEVDPLLIRCWSRDLLAGFVHCHENLINIRTLNPDTILINHNGVAQLSNLNCCSVIAHDLEKEKAKKRSKGVLELKKDNERLSDPYVAPEILLGAQAYSFESDAWCLAAVIAYLHMGKPLVPPRKTPFDYITSLYKIVGSPSDKNGPSLKNLPNYKKFKGVVKYKPNVARALASMMSTNPDQIEPFTTCLSKFLKLDPQDRQKLSIILTQDKYIDINFKVVGKEFAKLWLVLKGQICASKAISTATKKASEIFLSTESNHNSSDDRNLTRKVGNRRSKKRTFHSNDDRRTTNDFLNELSGESAGSDVDNLYDDEELFGTTPEAKKYRNR